jgi:hypothetical protein
MKATIQKITIEYNQEGDSVLDGLDQTLEISTEDAGSGHYYVIKSDRWAFDSPEELISILNDFEQRLKLETK